MCDLNESSIDSYFFILPIKVGRKNLLKCSDFYKHSFHTEYWICFPQFIIRYNNTQINTRKSRQFNKITRLHANIHAASKILKYIEETRVWCLLSVRCLQLSSTGQMKRMNERKSYQSLETWDILLNSGRFRFFAVFIFYFYVISRANYGHNLFKKKRFVKLHWTNNNETLVNLVKSHTK